MFQPRISILTCISILILPYVSTYELQQEISNNVVYMCEQQRLRPACAYAQSDQSLCKSLENSMTVKLLTKHHLEFPSLKGGCTGSSKSTLVKMPHYWKSYVTAHMYHYIEPSCINLEYLLNVYIVLVYQPRILLLTLCLLSTSVVRL